jgi:hypothetical protein
MNSRPPDAPKNADYMCFTVDHDAASAKREFLERHAHKAAFAFVELGLLRVGPIQKGEL